MPDAQIKGTCVASVMRLLREEHKQGEVLGRLGQRVRDVFSGPILPVSWYPLQSYVSLLDAIQTSYPAEGREVGFRVGRRVMQDGLSSVYKVVLKVASPEMVLKKAGMLWGFYFQGSKLTIVEEHPCNLLLSITDDCRPTPVYCLSLAGGMAETAERAGARDCRVIHPQCRAAGAKACLFRITWDE